MTVCNAPAVFITKEARGIRVPLAIELKRLRYRMSQSPLSWVDLWGTLREGPFGYSTIVVFRLDLDLEVRSFVEGFT